ncbi:hypothetical protein PHMEG_00021 [Phytophthora megakarya]|uniref:DDE Tnp4 domain-containing protein n=1 Tax=Phytophthora megakarya TaxID=4795 RepID=A0A225X6H4_9STRA|nr:hypothetical protein PHMEG_00021 [Phytophthora megakarya]
MHTRAEHEGWYCRKNYPVVHMQAVVDHQTKFRSYCIWAGSMNDQALWNNSGLRNNMCIPSGMHLLGDAAYKIFRHLSTPFQEEAAANDIKKKRYNYNLKPELPFRILLGKIQQKSPANVVRVIVSCIVLHSVMVELKGAVGLLEVTQIQITLKTT